LKHALQTQPEFVQVYLFSSLAISLIYALVAFLFMIMLSHRSAGPVYALMRFQKDLKTNPEAKFKLRRGDFHSELETFAQTYKEEVKAKE
jgi:signal peptidase II